MYCVNDIKKMPQYMAFILCTQAVLKMAFTGRYKNKLTNLVISFIKYIVFNSFLCRSIPQKTFLFLFVLIYFVCSTYIFLYSVYYLSIYIPFIRYCRFIKTVKTQNSTLFINQGRIYIYDFS